MLKLREELGRRGLKRVGSREEMIHRLRENEDTEVQEVTNPSLSMGEAGLNSLSRPFIVQEILKRNSEFLVPPRSSRKYLIETLNLIIGDEKGRGVNDLKSLILKSINNLAEISTKEICQVFEGLRDVYTISQFNMNTLHNSEPFVMIPIWNLILERTDTLNFQQITTILSAVCTLQESYKKKFTESGEKIDAGTIEKLLSRANKHEEDETSLDLAKLLHVSNLLLKEEMASSVVHLKAKMLSKLTGTQDLSDKELFTVLENLPAGAYKTHKVLIDEILARVQPGLPSISSEKLIAGVFGLHNAECVIPFKLVYYVDSIPKDFLKKLSPGSLFQLSQILASNQMLSEETGRSIIEV